MKALLLGPALLLATSASIATAQKTASDGPAVHEAAGPVARSGSDVKWGPVPAVLPAGAQIAVLEGNPFGEGVYTLRLRMPDGYTVPPHFHPTDEMVTVISGNLLFAHGDNIDRAATTDLHAGGFVTAPRDMHHYVIASGPTIVQVHGMGPFAITYVHSKDDPRAGRM